LADALNISSFEGPAHRGSILFRGERTDSRGVSLRPEINTLEGRLTKQGWLFFLQLAKNREHIGFAALRNDLHNMLLRCGFVGPR
jgi:hypothetical protein